MDLNDFDRHVQYGLAHAVGINHKELDFDLHSTHENDCHMAMDRRSEAVFLLGLDARALTVFAYHTWDIPPGFHVVLALPDEVFTDRLLDRWSGSYPDHHLSLVGYRRHNPPMLRGLLKGPFEEYRWTLKRGVRPGGFTV